MIPEITQKNVRLFIPYKVAKICDELCRQDHLTASEAILKFYKSNLSRLLGQEDTKLWQLGWVALFDMYQEEAHEH